MALKRKATFQPYDMDTALGTNNSGVLMFGYALEDTDTVSSIISGGDSGGTDAPVFNAQDSVLWCNTRDAFMAEISQMYQQLRTSGAWSAKVLIQRAHEHKGQWCEAIYNEDEYYKHLVPLINPVTVDEQTGQLIRTDRYLTMLQGSKEEQFKWWLYRRFRYTDSKYVTGDAVNSVISMRVFNSGTLTLKAAIDLYLAVRFGGGSTPILQRKDANEPAQFTYTAETGVTEMETWIYSADLITDVGDLSVFYGNEFDFSRATRLQRLKIGDSASTYSNANLKALDVRNSTLLEYIDVRNCPNLAITVNLEGSPRLKEAYFDGTAITGCDLADGASVQKLHLPGTITTLTLINLNKLTDFVCPDYSHVSRLMLSNMDAKVVDPVAVLRQIPANSQVNIQGLYLDMAGATEIEEFLDLLDTMRGVSREKNASGEWMYHDYDTAQVSGTIHTASLTGAQIASYNQRYPYITVTADTVISNLTYASYDGTTVYKVVECRNGVPQEGAPSNPSRPATPQNTFTFIGWSKSMNSTTADADAAVDVIADRTIYAAYSVQSRTYTVRFYNGSTLLETDTGIPYGGSTTYNGATPVSPEGSAEDYPFEGWKPAPTNIQGDTSCYAQFGSPVEVVEITDSWDTIIANIDNGTYKTAYKIGNYKPLDLGTEGTINMQIAAIDADELADGSGYAPLTFIGMELLNTYHAFAFNDDRTWASTNSSAMRPYLQGTVFNLFPANVKNRVQMVRKYSSGVSDYTIDTLFIPSIRELFGTLEQSGVAQYATFKQVSNRIRSKVGDSAHIWWTRSYGSGTRSYYVLASGNKGSTQYAPTDQYGICLGFCLGLEPETITDTWEQIFQAESDGTYSTKYSIGDTKEIDLGSEGKHLMEIVAFDTDDKADGSGKAKITWISKGLLNTAHNMNTTKKTVDGETAYTAGGWEHSDMRAYLKDTVKPLIPETVRNAIVPVTKVSSTYTGDALVTDGQTTTDDVWIPSNHEVFPTVTTYESTGAKYSSKFTKNASRIKKRRGSAKYWWLRSAYNAVNFRYAGGDGYSNYNDANYAGGVALGFCT